MSNLTNAEIKEFAKFITAKLKQALPGKMLICQVDSPLNLNVLHKASFIEESEFHKRSPVASNGQAANKATTSYIFLKRLIRNSNNKESEIRYDVVLSEELGRGSFGNVYPLLITFLETESGKIRPKFSSRQRVIKYQYQEWNEDFKNDYKKWEAVIKKESHLGKIFDTRFSTIMLKDSAGSKAYSIMTKASGERIDKYIMNTLKRSVDFKNILAMIVSILRALQAIHQAGFVHMDIKPDNILYDEKTGLASIIDFGLLVKIGTEKMPSGNASYSAPEMFQLNTKTGGLKKILCKPAMDCFSLAIIFLQLLKANNVFGTLNKNDINLIIDARLNNFTHNKAGLFNGLNIDDATRTDVEVILDKMMHINPAQRITTDEALRSFENIQLDIDPQVYLQHQINFSHKQLRENQARLSAAIQNAMLILQDSINQLALELNSKENISKDSKGFNRGILYKKYNTLMTINNNLDNLNREIQKNLESNNITQELFKEYYAKALHPLLAEENRKLLSKNRARILEIFNIITLPWSLFVGAIKGVISHRWQTFNAGFFATRSAKSLVEATAVLTNLKLKLERK